MKNAIIIGAAASLLALSACDKPSNGAAGSSNAESSVSIESVKAGVAKISEKAKAQMDAALKKLDALPKDYDTFVSEHLSAEKFDSLIDNAKKVDLSEAPEDFKQAYDKAITSAESLGDKIKNMPSVDTKGSALDSIKSLADKSGDDIKKWGEDVKKSFEDFKASTAELYNSAKSRM